LYQVHLTDEQQQELHRRAHTAGIAPRTRDRLEMVRLSAAGWSIPRIAGHLQLSEVRVRYWIKRFLAGGFAALPDQPHRGQQSQLSPPMEEAIRQELRQGARTWTASQLAEWVAQQWRVHLTPEHLARRLKQAGISYQRTGRSVKHKQKPAEVELKRAALVEHEKRGTRARST